MNLRVKKNALFFVIMSVVALALLLFGIVVPLTYYERHSTGKMIISSQIDTSNFDQSGPSGVYVMSREEFEEFKAEDADVITFDTYEEYIGSTSASFVESSASFTQETTISEYNPSITATGANAKLYNYCDKYFQCFYGDKRISPIFPLAIANVETGGRADHNLTWSSLFPSAIVDISLIDTFDVTTVLTDDTIFKKLTSDYSTRDRGALQMSPTYGTGTASINKHMSGTEVDKLKKVDTSKYATWCSGASSCAGDRFYIPDMLLRLQAAMNYNLQQFVTKGYNPTNTYHMLAMMSVGHNSGSGVFSQQNPNRKVGNWKSASACYDWCSIVSDAAMISILTDYYNYSGSITIDTNIAEKLLHKFDNSISYTSYTTSKTNAYYPIKFLYTYIALSNLYTR